MVDASQTAKEMLFYQRHKSNRHTPHQARAKESVRKIIAAAAYLFIERGIEKTTTNSIAQRAGMPIGSVYIYFKNKRSILESLYETYANDMADIVDSLIDDSIVPITQSDVFVDSLTNEWTEYVKTNRPDILRSFLKSEPEGQRIVRRCHSTIIMSLARAITIITKNNVIAVSKAITLLELANAYCDLADGNCPESLRAASYLRQSAISLIDLPLERN